ncbi:hypothetical protein HGI47_13375 [Novosphingobium sp. ERN07]|uniref:hypothetical protein n=1 Tax=Novosphingobium sp. ERN07 TaxID=2726187 RepID=UPI00145710F8|nr:hypothetical protein [Novosphingobium sp. ERN07]NLR71862.1 hypothetical protein [Novosphingobium sp. ERN07]
MALLFAAIFAGAVLAMEGGALYLINSITDHQFSPRGAGWGLMIIAAAIGGGKMGYRSVDEFSLARMLFEDFLETKEGRLTTALILIWLPGWTIYSWLYLKDDEYCYYDCGWSEGDWAYFVSFLIGIPTAILALHFLLKWIRAGK